MATTTSYSGPPEWMQPYYESFLNGAMQTANRPYQQYQGPRVAGLSGIQTGALGGINSAMYGSPQTQYGQGLLGDIMQGDNQYVDQIANRVTRDARKEFDSATAGINSRFENPNSFGNARHQMAQDSANEAFVRGMGDSLSSLRYNAFDTNRARQMQAASQSANMDSNTMNNFMMGLQAGNVPRQVQQQQYDTGYQDWNNWWNYPTQQADNMARWLGMGGNYQQSTQQTPDPSRTSQITGGLLAASPFLAGLFGYGG